MLPHLRVVRFFGVLCEVCGRGNLLRVTTVPVGV